MRRAFAFILPVLAAPVIGFLIVVAVRADHKGHRPAARYVQAMKADNGNWKWADAPKGHLKGSLKFSHRRPNQPIIVYLLRINENGDTAAQGVFDLPPRLDVSQKGARFDPAFAVLVRGQTIRYLNDEDEDISHNVYFLGDFEADLGLFGRNEHRDHAFDHYGEVNVHCSIHRRMDARLLIAPNPAFDEVPGDRETFSIRDVPAGRYRLLTWQKQKRFRDAVIEIEVKAGETRDLLVELSR